MIQFVVTVLVASIVGSQIQVSDAQAQLTTVIRIQSYNDFSFLGVPPFGFAPPTTTTPATTTTTAAPGTPTDPPPTAGPTTPAPEVLVPVGPLPQPNPDGYIAYWKVSWANALKNDTGTVIVASDARTTQFRCINTALTIQLLPSLPQSKNELFWNFLARFDPITYTYKYKIMSSKNQCLKKAGPNFETSACGDGREFLFNILS